MIREAFCIGFGGDFFRFVKSLSNFRKSSGGGGFRFGFGAARTTRFNFCLLGFSTFFGLGLAFGNGGAGFGVLQPKGLGPASRAR